jgi:thiamine-phosphate pyrophosphorylase
VVYTSGGGGGDNMEQGPGALYYAITSGTGFLPNREASLAALTARVTSHRIHFLQLREKDLEAGALAVLARELLFILRSHTPAPRLLINSRADIALAVGADGVHLTSAAGELTPAQIRQLYASAGSPEPVVSVSCHTLADVERARDSAADLILFGPIFEKRVSGKLISAGTGLESLRAACEAAGTVPLLALGGVAADDVLACLATGAAGVAGIRLFSGRWTR